MNYNYIVIEGCIGAGKSTLAEAIAQDFNAQLILERFEDNCFLPKFYADPKHYAFPLEMSFLTDRYQQLKESLSQRDLFKNIVVSDYFIDKCIIFSKNNLSEDEFMLYRKVFDIVIEALPRPELIIYLYNDVQKLQRQIKQRGRDYEQSIADEYLDDIQKSYLNYFKFTEKIPVLIIDVNNSDFVQNKNDYLKIKELLEQKYTPQIHRIIF